MRRQAESKWWPRIPAVSPDTTAASLSWAVAAPLLLSLLSTWVEGSCAAPGAKTQAPPVWPGLSARARDGLSEMQSHQGQKVHHEGVRAPGVSTPRDSACRVRRET